MSPASTRILLASLLFAFSATPITGSGVPRIWDQRALEDWATPIAALSVRPANYTAAEYYAVPDDNLRTYPLYRPDKEPPGFWKSLQHKRPEKLVDASLRRTPADWIAAGGRRVRGVRIPLPRDADP